METWNPLSKSKRKGTAWGRGQAETVDYRGKYEEFSKNEAED